MAIAVLTQKLYKIKKETTRLTAEASAVSARSLAVMPDTEVNQNPTLLLDEKLRREAVEREAQDGVRDVAGSLNLDSSPDNIGELMLSLFGKVVTDQPDFGGAPLVFRHKFTKDNTVQHATHSLFTNREIHKKVYNGLTARSVAISYPVDNRVNTNFEVVGITEATFAGAIDPDFSAELPPFLFNQITVTLGGISSLKVRSATVNITNNAALKRALALTRDPLDIIANRLIVRGTMQLYFEDEVERAKVLAGTVTDLKLLAEGATIQAAQKYTLEVDLPRVKYASHSFADEDGILVLNFDFQAYRDETKGYPAQVTLINKVTSY